MNNSTTKTFDSFLHSSKFSFLEECKFETLYFVGTIIIGIYILFTHLAFAENPIIYGIFAIFVIVAFYSLLFIVIKFFTKKVIKLKFELNTITFTYRYKRKISEYTTRINTTSIELLELRNHKSHFEGIEINFKDEIGKRNFKLIENNWSYFDFENIYIEFKKRKNEEIPENEISVFKQLQLINNSLNKNIA